MYFAVYCRSSPDGLIPLTYRRINSDCLLLDQAVLPPKGDVERAGKERMMGIHIDETAVQDRVNPPVAPGYGEIRFERRPWERISERREDRFPVTLWIGLKALVVAVAVPGVEPDVLSLSVREAGLRLQGPAGTGTFSKDIDLPYAVEMPPILVKDGKDTLYILLQRK